MLEGGFKHEDNKGHKGTIGVGDVQWMTAGRGIVHSEMPATDGRNVGLQLWVNLSSNDKMTKVRISLVVSQPSVYTVIKVQASYIFCSDFWRPESRNTKSSLRKTFQQR